ncbi:NAD(P)/FAD-dependent oxidoreductase [Methylotenera sp. 1P/1]|uniref:NAD(P)/FAD-dependent oxidoreductase n=1 Tax=Methylotenera sp. 1P/1 TaxID=1131551 RepID=UPI00036F7A48|nr:NAD(P)/FAD-dependent oxidoreductase [Methylotenera sp. 1P/1]
MDDNSMENTTINRPRRRLIKAAAYTSALIVSNTSFARASKPPLGRVVIIGGGYAGTTAAKYIRMWSMGNIETVVIEQSSQFVSCPLSNLVLGGSKSIHDLTFGYDLVKKNHGIQWVNDTVTSIDADKKRVRMARDELSYDRLVIAPGVDVNYEKIPNLASAEAQALIPHAWKAGWQTVNLRAQLEAMPDGGVFVMTIPKAPYRCPPGPYERACQVASYFKAHKPKSKVIVLDANPEITSKKGLFNQAFMQTYAGIVDYRPNNDIVSVDVAHKTVTTEFEQVKADVLNVIPPQRAGKVAQSIGLNNVDQRWCEVDFLSYASTLHSDIHVIGDSVSAGLPKSAHMATSQARVCAAAVVALMSGDQPDPTPVFANTCYSFIDDRQAVHVAHVYRYDAAKKIMVPAEGGGVSTAPSDQEGQYAFAWANNIWSDVLT